MKILARAIFPLLVLAAAFLSGCYRGGAKPVEMSTLVNNPQWIALGNVPVVIQDGEHECGAAAVSMVLSYWGQETQPDDVRRASAVSTEKGIPAGFLRDYLRTRGMQAYLVQGTFTDIERELRSGRPVLVGVQRKFTTGLYAHYQVVVGINLPGKELAVIDPAEGFREYSFADFAKEWTPANALTLVVSPPAVALENR